MLPSLDFLSTLAQQRGDEIAIEDSSAQVSYSELLISVNALAVALQVKDPIPASKVGLCAANSMEYIVSMLAILAAGKTLVPLNCYGTSEQLHQILIDTHPSAIIVDKLGDALIKSEDELKIPFSQFPGLVLTYRDQTPQRHDVTSAENS
ncbi:long-chain fatty acid--CoA ligase [Candidimonas sp. SYP-B2681]|uniref:AMP-binding protein n=1 Tax=Candidimonas sp. SYP-B2681 TaxID=2497686 RepID=UPI000F861274|nr:AMP-binding protein [Candidimonas sp. SYP-B2681]RTZ44654.1 long-chain fatty acid--CoA ligase [Candidimonas sp. SYP-B2681]